MLKPKPNPTRDEPDLRGPICKRCSLQNVVGRNRCSGCGCALAGNKLSMKHGAFAHRDRPELAEIRIAAEKWAADVRASQGGVELAPVRDGAVNNIGDLEFLRRLLVEDLKINGLHTKSKKGGPSRVRSSFPLLLQVLDRWSRYALMLGLDARQAQVIESPREWLERISEKPDEQGGNHAATDSAERSGQNERDETDTGEIES